MLRLFHTLIESWLVEYLISMNISKLAVEDVDYILCIQYKSFSEKNYFNNKIIRKIHLLIYFNLTISLLEYKIKSLYEIKSL